MEGNFPFAVNRIPFGFDSGGMFWEGDKFDDIGPICICGLALINFGLDMLHNKLDCSFLLLTADQPQKVLSPELGFCIADDANSSLIIRLRFWLGKSSALI